MKIGVKRKLRKIISLASAQKTHMQKSSPGWRNAGILVVHELHGYFVLPSSLSLSVDVPVYPHAAAIPLHRLVAPGCCLHADPGPVRIAAVRFPLSKTFIILLL